MKYVTVSVLLLTALAAGQSYIGRVDTIGGTTHDWQMTWGAQRRLVEAPGFGLHAVWLWSTTTSGTTFPDRNMRYNYFDFSIQGWYYFDPDFMQSGVNTFPDRMGFGGLAGADPATGCAVIYSYRGSTGLRPMIARDAAPGAGIFDYAEGPQGYLWPVAAVGSYGEYHVAMMDDSTREGLSYSRIRAGNWPTWDSVRPLAQTGYSNHSIASTRSGPEVCVCWIEETGDVFYRVSTDRGDTWLGVDSLPLPPAFGGDTVPAFSLFGPFAFFDSQDRLHFAVPVVPVVNDTQYVQPAEIWHWCAQNSPNWAMIHHAGCMPEHMLGGVGYNAAYACRPSLGEDRDGNLYVAWEQFDSSNVEPQTGLLRAGIWEARSTDGTWWTPGRILTGRNTVSHRFPSIIDINPTGCMHGDTVLVLYEMDQVAGFAQYGQGPYTSNPIVCQFAIGPSGVEESPAPQAPNHEPAATILAGASGVRRLASSVVYDAMGRRVLDPKPGVYFVHEGSGPMGQGSGRMRKVILQR